MGFRKNISLMLAALMLFPAFLAASDTEKWNGADSGAQNIYRPNVVKQDMSFLQPIELTGMAAGVYLACRSHIMSNCMDAFKAKTDVWSVVSNSGLVIITVFAGTVLGGVTSAMAFGPMDPEFESIKEKDLPDGTRVSMVVSGALLMGAGGYIGYNVGRDGRSGEKYGEAILIGSIAGAIVGSYIGEQLGNMLFGPVKKKKK